MSVKNSMLPENTNMLILTTYLCKSLYPKKTSGQFLMFKTESQSQSSKT